MLLPGEVGGGENFYKMFLTREQLTNVQTSTIITSVSPETSRPGDREASIFPQTPLLPWNGDNYGPLSIPKGGMKITINDSTLAMYGDTIVLYDANGKATVDGDQLLLDGKPVNEYTFTKNYYFMMGDNRHNSLDSRYWGFVPEDHIVGKPLFIWLSVDKDADLLSKIRWNRIFTRVQ